MTPPGSTPIRRPRPSVRGMMMAVAFVALAIAWSAHYSDCKYRAAMHAGMASQHRVFAGAASLTDWARDHQRRKAEWHEEMSRRFERAKWLPWPSGPSEPPGPR